MKKLLFKIFAIALFGSASVNTYADPIAELMRSGASDIDKMANIQLSPLGNSIAAGLGGGWYNTAKPHKLFGFDLTLTLNLAAIPSSEKLFDFSKQGFKALQLANPNANPMTPTFIAGNDITGPDLKIVFPLSKITLAVDPLIISAINNNPVLKNDLAKQNITLDAVKNNLEYTPVLPESSQKSIPTKGFVPSWLPIAAFPIPTIQGAIGLPKNTEISFRFLPNIEVGGLKLGMYGFAVKHDFKQWIPVVKDFPIDASVLFGYTKFSSSYDLKVTPDLYGDINILAPNSTRWNGQEMALNASAFTTNIIVSKNFLFITPYIGFGFTSTAFELAMKGNYPLVKAPVLNPSTLINIPTLAQISSGTNITVNTDQIKLVSDDEIKGTDFMTDPININPTNFMPNASIGVRVKLLLVTIHAQYTIQEYPMYTAGFGFSFR